jgi:hypothetical protein
VLLPERPLYTLDARTPAMPQRDSRLGVRVIPTPNPTPKPLKEQKSAPCFSLSVVHADEREDAW